MEQTLTIDGKQVTFKSTAATPRRYKVQFGRDFFRDMLKLFPLTKLDLEKAKDDDETFQVLIEALDFDMFYDILWAMAKTADKEIPEPMEWLDGFDEFPLTDILKEAFPLMQSMLAKNMQTKKK